MPTRDVLSGVLPEIKRLRLSAATSEQDYSFLEQAESLAELEIWASSTVPVDFAELPLESLALDADENWISLKRSTTLRELLLIGGDLSWLPTASPLESLSLYSMRKNRDLTQLRAFPKLKRVRLEGNGELCLRGIASLTELEELRLTSFATVNDIEELLSLPKLRSFFIEDIKKVDSISSLYELRKKARVVVVGTKAWHREIRDADETK